MRKQDPNQKVDLSDYRKLTVWRLFDFFDLIAERTAARIDPQAISPPSIPTSIIKQNLSNDISSTDA